MFLVFTSSLYATLNNFVFKVNSKLITIKDDEISFEAYAKKDVYTISKIESFKVKEFPSSGKLYIRIEDDTGKKRKYWIHTFSFNESKNLFKNILEIEHKKHPETLKAQARLNSSLTSD